MSQVVVARADAIAHDAPASDGSFRVLTENLLALTADIERLGPRAARLGTARLALRDTGRREGRHAFVMLEGEAPALLGWTLAAIVDHRHDASAIRSIVPLGPHRPRRPSARSAEIQPRIQHQITILRSGTARGARRWLAAVTRRRRRSPAEC